MCRIVLRSSSVPEGHRGWVDRPHPIVWCPSYGRPSLPDPPVLTKESHQRGPQIRERASRVARLDFAMLRTPMHRSLAARLAQTAPVVIGSVVLHVGIALALVATAGGHARAGVTLPVVTLEVDVAPIDAPTLERSATKSRLREGRARGGRAHAHAPVPGGAVARRASSRSVAGSRGGLCHASSRPRHEAEPAPAAPVQVAEAAALPASAFRRAQASRTAVR